MIATGTLLQNRYRIDKQIGQGGMGAVYVATDERFGSVVAIKETLCMDDNYRHALEREARLLNSLKHSALPRVSDHFLEDEGQFLVMEFVSGEDIFSRLDSRSEPFPHEQVLDWADQLLDALDYLHNQEHPVIHRDIKPQNLKLTPKGQMILLDFGLAKGNPTDAGNKTAAKSIFGYSRNYASLEQIQGTGTDPRSDLYSLAATLYHLMTGVPPEDALTRAMTVLSQQPDPLKPAHALQPSIPLGVSAVLSKALDLNAAQRPGSAAEMRTMLKNYHIYGHETNLSAPAIPMPLQGASFAKATNLEPEGTHGGAVVMSEAPTELMPDDRSQVTSVKNAAAATGAAAFLTSDGRSPNKKRGHGLRYAVGVVFGLVIACMAGAGIYFYEEGAFARPEPAAVEPPVAASEADTSNIDPQSNGTTLESAASSGSTSKESQTADAKRETARSQRSGGSNSSTATNDLDGDPEDEKVEINGDNIVVGNMTIRKGKLVTRDGVIDLKEPPAPPQTRPGFPFEYRNLTPAQRRRLLNMRRQDQGVTPGPSPRN